jgi:integrase
MYFYVLFGDMMLLIQTANFTVVTKYYTNNNGQHYYQRAIPLALRKFYGGQKRIRKKLTGSQTSMSIEIARLAREDDAAFNKLRQSTGSDHLEAEALAILAMHGNRPGDALLRHIPSSPVESDTPHLDDIEHYLRHKFSIGKFSEADKLAKLLLTKPMPVMLSKVLDIYFENHPKGLVTKFRKDAIKHWKHIYTVIPDMELEQVTRDMAKRYIKERLRLVTTNSVSREISTIKAAIASVILEKGLDIKNPFESQTIPNLGKDAKVRKPFALDEYRLLITGCIKKSDDIRTILLLCMLTGARLAEVTGLRRQDVILDATIPHINLIEYGDHTLKTKNSTRKVPLLSQAIEALTKQLNSHQDGTVFPRYADGVDVNATSISGALSRYIKTIGITGKTTHNARHTVKDLLLHADVPESLIFAIGGWGTQSVGGRYGEGYSLKQKADALVKAFNPIFG